MVSTTAQPDRATEETAEQRAGALSAFGGSAHEKSRSADGAAGDVISHAFGNGKAIVAPDSDLHPIVEAPTAAAGVSLAAEGASSSALGAPLSPIEVPPLALDALLQVDMTALDVDDLGNLRDMVITARSEVSQRYQQVIARTEAELTRRIKESGGRALPSFEFEKIELVDEYTGYAFNDAAIEAALPLLPEADRKKIGQVVPEHTELVPRRFVRGSTASILAAIKRYGPDSEIGKRLSAAMSRSKTGERLVIKRAPTDEQLLGAR